MSKDIVLVVADTLTAFHLPFYGYERDTAPFLSKLAEDNVLFKHAYAPAPWTVPVHASMFTGEMPDVCETNSENLYFDSRSVVENLSESGYRTIGISNNYLVSETLGFDRGFDFYRANDGIYLESRGLNSLREVFNREQKGRYDSKKEKYLDFAKLSFLNLDFKSVYEGFDYFLRKKLDDSHRFYEDKGADMTNSIVKNVLDETDQDFFLFLNYMETHQPFRLPDGFELEYLDNPGNDIPVYHEEVWDKDLDGSDTDQRLIDISKNFYDCSIKYLDSKIEELYREIDDRSDEFIFIVLGDHGEMLGDQNKWGHQNGIWQELLRVPLIVAGPDLESKVIEDKFSLRKVKDLIEGAKPEELTQEKVFAAYEGVEGYVVNFGDGGVPEDEMKKKFFHNKSRAVVEDGEMYVRNTHLDDLRYTVEPNRKGKVLEPQEIPNSIKIRFGEDLENLEF